MIVEVEHKMPQYDAILCICIFRKCVNNTLCWLYLKDEIWRCHASFIIITRPGINQITRALRWLVRRSACPFNKDVNITYNSAIRLIKILLIYDVIYTLYSHSQSCMKFSSFSYIPDSSWSIHINKFMLPHAINVRAGIIISLSFYMCIKCCKPLMWLCCELSAPLLPLKRLRVTSTMSVKSFTSTFCMSLLFHTPDLTTHRKQTTVYFYHQ